MRRYLDDLCVAAGAVSIGVGVWHVWPTGVWFYAGAVLVAAGLLVGRVTPRASTLSATRERVRAA